MTDETQVVDTTTEDAPAPTSIFALFGTDVDASENGKWFHNFAGTGIDLKITRFSSRKAQRARLRAVESYKRFLKDGVFPDEINEKIAIEQMANGVLVDWKNIFDDDGKEMPYSVATCKSLLAKLPELRLAIAGASLDMDNFRTETRNDVLGNSSST